MAFALSVYATIATLWGLYAGKQQKLHHGMSPFWIYATCILINVTLWPVCMAAAIAISNKED